MSIMLQEDQDHFNDPVQFGPKQLVSSTKLVRNLSSCLDMAQKAPIFIEREQEVQAVLISVDDYRNLLREEEKVEDLYLCLTSIRRKIEQLVNNQEKFTTNEMLQELGLPIDILPEGGKR